MTKGRETNHQEGRFIKTVARLHRKLELKVTSGVILLAFCMFATAPGIFQVGLGTAVEDFVSSPSLENLRRIEQTYPSQDTVTLIFRSKSGPFSVQAVGLAKRIETELLKIPQFQANLSLLSGRGVPDKLSHLFAEAISSEDEKILRESFSNALESPFRGKLISSDERHLRAIFSIPVGGDSESIHERIGQAKRYFEPQAADAGLEWFVSGGSLTEIGINDSVFRDTLRILPACALLFFCLCCVFYRSMVSVLLPLATSIPSILITLGIMGYAGISITPLTMCVPGFILIIGSTEDMHLLSQFIVDRKADSSTKPLASLSHMLYALTLTAFTSAVGFLVYAISDIVLIREFGLACAAGMIVNLLVTIIVGPLLLDVIAPGRKAAQLSYEGVLRKILRSKTLKLLIPCTALVVIVFGIFRYSEIRTDANFREFISSESQEGRIFELSISHFDGGDEVLFEVQCVNGGTNQIAESTERVSAYLRSSENFQIANYTGGAHLPHSSVNDRSLIPAKLSSRVTPSEFLTIVDAAIVEMNAAATNTIVAATGYTYETAQASGRLSGSAKKSFIYAFTVVAVVIILMCLRAPRLILASLVANCLPVSVVVLLMVELDIPLSFATAPILAVVLGIAADDTIHFVYRYFHLEKLIESNNDLIEEVAVSEAQPVLSSSLGLSVGFSAYLFSAFPSLYWFALLSVVGILAAMISDLVVMPVTASILGRKKNTALIEPAVDTHNKKIS